VIKGDGTMKIKVKSPFFDANGIHKVGEIVEVKEFRPELMELVAEKKVKEIKESIDEAPVSEPETAVKKPRKTTRKKV